MNTINISISGYKGTGENKQLLSFTLGTITDLKEAATKQIAACIKKASELQDTYKMKGCELHISMEGSKGIAVALSQITGTSEAVKFASANFNVLLNLPYLFIERKTTDKMPTEALKDELLIDVAKKFGWKEKTITLVQYQTAIQLKAQTFSLAVKRQQRETIATVANDFDKAERVLALEYRKAVQEQKKLSAPAQTASPNA